MLTCPYEDLPILGVHDLRLADDGCMECSCWSVSKRLLLGRGKRTRGGGRWQRLHFRELMSLCGRKASPP